MSIEEFWNKAFLACLSRLSVEEAKQEADKATQACIDHWHEHRYSWAQKSRPWKDQSIADCPGSPTK